MRPDLVVVHGRTASRLAERVRVVHRLVAPYGGMVLALTQSGGSQDRALVLSEGAHDCLEFPCTEQELGLRVQRLLDHRAKCAAVERLEKISSSTHLAMVSNMSHELRTPLNAIVGFCDLMAQTGLRHLTEETFCTYLRYMQTGADHLLQLVNNLLEVARIAAGRSQMSFEEVDVHDLIFETVHCLLSLAQRKGIVFNLPEGDQGSVSADPVRIRQVLFNLLSNAIKFTPAHGAITVDVAHTSDELRLRVSDTGIGISAADQKTVFEPFTRVGAAAASEGTGLGLTITRDLVQAHGGTIELRSEPGHGTCVTVVLPRHREAPRGVER